MALVVCVERRTTDYLLITSGRVIKGRVVWALENELHGICEGNSSNPRILPRRITIPVNALAADCGSRVITGVSWFFYLLGCSIQGSSNSSGDQEINLAPGCVGPAVNQS